MKKLIFIVDIQLPAAVVNYVARPRSVNKNKSSL